ncbi:PREDICTED: protein-tyrosine-phosphatase MKP1 isoform X4 [Nelumbo nucifera]|uniref:Protein-tyrosine-phosphatase MKP1 isoform X4 n=1 Tax=Nelumbo nucifera TaxID=4432 RepID=A0A1U7ZJL4_NELNU|nr:PREDICTED: protein-tyrosine-phosphatase MKP1 isoform X4 [Nelumbo nucifera]
MVGEEDAAGSRGQCQISGSRKTFWRSASWSSRSMPQATTHFDNAKDCADPHGTDKNSGQCRRFPVPLTPRSQNNSKARACLPPLQPLSISRRSLDEWPKAGSDDVGEWPQPPTPSGRGDLNKSGDGLRLDLPSSFQKNQDPTGTLVKKDRIAFFDKECSKVADHIYLGGDAVARNRDILRQNGITHVLNCVGFVCPEYFKSDLVYKTLWLQDSPSEDITSILYDVFDYFEDVREQGGRVLVHCCQGVSRSTSLVIAYLMWREGQSFDDAFQYVKAARGIANPNMGFACQLLQCQKRVHAIPLSPSSVLRMYRMAPHSSYDPLHLVPKMLNDPSPSALDSRGAFIIHVPSAIYVWIGKKCETIMERDAKGAAFQVVRYERVQGPIITVVEGEEPSDFWDAFSNLQPSVSKSENVVEVESAEKIVSGERRVDSYNIDFELFHKAITGGVVPPFSSSGSGQETHLPARESNWSVLRRKFAFANVKEFVSASKKSPSPNSPEAPGLGHASKPCSQTVPSSKKFIMSLAERRGGLSPSLKLPTSTDGTSLSYRRMKNDSLASLVTQRDNNEKDSSCLLGKLKEQVLESGEVIAIKEEDGVQGVQFELCSRGLYSDDPHSMQEALVKICHAQEVSKHSTGLMDDGSESCGQVQPTVCRWPDLERVAAFGACDLDSEAVFLFLVPTPSTGVEKHKYLQDKVRVLYLWIGKSFEHGKRQLQLDNSRDVGDVEEIDWHQVGSYFLTKMGLRKDILIKVVKEGKEPEDFIELLKSL